MKQSIVKEATMSEFNGKKSYTATFEDGVKGYYDAKTIGELKQGDHVEYTAEEKTNKNGGKYNLLTVSKTEAQPSAPVIPVAKEPRGLSLYEPSWDMFIAKERIESTRVAITIAMDAVKKDELEFDKVTEGAKLVNTFLQEAIDDVLKLRNS